MSRSFVLIVLSLGVGVTSASAAVIHADFAFVGNGDTLPLFDDFDNEVLDSPPWSVLSGSPGPESGTELELHDGDLITASAEVDPLLGVFAGVFLSLTEFSAGSATSLLMYGEDPGDFLGLLVLPDAVMMGDESGVLSAIPLDPAGVAALYIDIGTNGVVTGVVNSTVVFSGPHDFTPSGDIGIAVAPEPGAAAMVTVLLAARLMRRRRR
ncbi:MAG: hypothetical protein GY842_01425 [bacterium]|nr:hypothetical protein [bacterium]